MALVKLGRYEARRGHLPPVCMSCGIAAGVYRSYRAVPVYWLLLILVPLIGLPALVIVFSQAPLVRAPLCEFHRYHWRWRNSLVFLGLLVSAGLTVASFFSGADSDKPLVFGMIVVPMMTFVLAVVFRYSAIHAARTNRVSITLRRISPEFIEAHRVQCHDDWGTDDPIAEIAGRESQASKAPTSA
jgi:hypothetical protein